MLKNILNNSLTKFKVTTIFTNNKCSNLPVLGNIYKNKNYNFILSNYNSYLCYNSQLYSQNTKNTSVFIITEPVDLFKTNKLIHTALLEEIPMVIFTCLPSLINDKSIIDITKESTKWSYSLYEHSRNSEKIINIAFNLANNERPGPVLINLPNII